ncbi:cytochrome P450 [Mycoplana sp. BE70]|uniref:cytochrome P450 n=1 Tax=Mycoplana sp. BE70 TaxID=2817775 RepID=UPI002862CF6E|nr:cytochrome P450 [Mycoplana sp. BE70]MDR6755776.1 cytochrome P450 [Mycoplana sp. BE70]
MDISTPTVPNNISRLDIDPYDDVTLEHPFAMHEVVRNAGSVAFMERYGVYVMGRHADVAPVLQDWQRFSSTSGSGIADIRKPGAWRAPSPIVEVDPPDHTKVRMAVQRILTPALIREWKELFADYADELVGNLVDAGRIDAVSELSERFVAHVFPRTIGWADSPGRTEKLFLLGQLNFDGQGPRNARFLATEAAAAKIMDWNNAQMRREALLPGGFGEKIYAAADRGEIEPETAPLLIRSFLRGGLDTTSAMISAAIQLLSEAPEQYEMLRRDVTRVRSVLDETMRLETPIQTVCRLTMEDVTFADGRTVPKDNKIIVLLSAANRDPLAWERPDEFDITRKMPAHVALGTGVHMCIGQMIARMEGELVLKALVKHVKSIRPSGATSRNLNNNLRSFASVPVELKS